MNRNLSALSNDYFDLVVVGGGIFGICAAWDAALRGLSVAILERNDFAHAASGNCFKIVHGGIRYLQHGDIVRLRQSSHERNTFLRIAPHLVRPLPIAIPTYGHLKNGKELLYLATGLYDALTVDRNRAIADPARRIPRTQFLSRPETLDKFPGLDPHGLTGAAIIYDGQMHSPTRLAISILRGAVDAGVQAANYVEVTGFLKSGNRVFGIRARDRLTSDEFEVRGRLVLNAAGAWSDGLLNKGLGVTLSPKPTYSRDAYFIVGRNLFGDCALAVKGRTKDPDAIVSRGARHLFLVPWNGCTLVGVWHVVHKGSPDRYTVTEQDLLGFLEEINAAYRDLQLTLDDVTLRHCGLVLFGRNDGESVHLSFGKRSCLVDHEKVDGIEGLLTLLGVRYTTARCEAERAIDLAVQKLGRPARPCLTGQTAVHGGHVPSFDDFLARLISEYSALLPVGAIRNLAHNYGSAYSNVLKYTVGNPFGRLTLGPSVVVGAEVIHAVREEMAVKLADVVFRRTNLGTGSFPGEQALVAAADLMAVELAWDQRKKEEEIAEVMAVFSRHSDIAQSRSHACS